MVVVLGLDGQQPITNDRWINVTQKAHPADLRVGPFLLAAGSWREWDCQTFLSYGYEDLPAPMARPFSKGLRDWGCRTLDFIRLGGSILRRRRGPSLGTYGIGVVTHWILYGYGAPSCTDGAALLQGPTGLGLSHIGFYTARGIHPAPMAWPFSRGLWDLE